MQVAPCYFVAEEQGQEHLLHQPYVQPHRPIFEADWESLKGQDMVAMHTRLAQLQSQLDQQRQVRNVMKPW